LLIKTDISISEPMVKTRKNTVLVISDIEKVWTVSLS